MPRRKLTAADFPPEFMDIWNLAVKGKLSLTMDSAGAARNFIQRLYTFRKRLMEEAPAIATSFYLVDLRAHDVQGNVITGKATSVPGPAIVKNFVPAWKAQVADLTASLPTASLPFSVPERTTNTAALTEEEGEIPVPSPSGDSLSGTLEMLGFGTKKE